MSEIPAMKARMVTGFATPWALLRLSAKAPSLIASRSGFPRPFVDTFPTHKRMHKSGTAVNSDMGLCPKKPLRPLRGPVHLRHNHVQVRQKLSAVRRLGVSLKSPQRLLLHRSFPSSDFAWTTPGKSDFP
jgi:hypothetical protein